jgi:hypothetical protein
MTDEQTDERLDALERRADNIETAISRLRREVEEVARRVI